MPSSPSYISTSQENSYSVLVQLKMENKENMAYLDECRINRQHRLQLRRRQKARTEEMRKLVILPPEVGVMAVKGKRSSMEDEVFVQENLCAPSINRGQPVHFFAVYDGHGGHEVSTLCKKRLHLLVKKELMYSQTNAYMMSGSSSSSVNRGQEQEWEAEWRRILQRCFLRIDKMASSNCDCGNLGYTCNCPPNYNLSLTGSTAIIAILTDHTIVIANCGDSRAVLSRDGMSIPLSVDHKPNRPDEVARIKKYGGKFVYSNGLRVEGILSMTRAIGDSFLKPYVISEPEITFTKRSENDECLILASDGLWDVVSTEMACHVARECLQGDTVFSSRSASAAALLTRIAMERGSNDNISVIVVDLTQNRTGREKKQ